VIRRVAFVAAVAGLGVLAWIVARDTRAPEAPPAGASVEFTQILVVYRRPQSPSSKATRSREEALALAKDLIRRLEAGEKMGPLLEAHTDDRDEAGRVYNRGVYVLVEGGPGMPGLFRAVWKTPVGRVGHEPFDGGMAFVVFRRDA
jgi:hypothetical protein